MEKGRKILDSDDEIGIIKDNFLELLMENGVGREVVMKPEELLVHPSNRGGLLVNAFNSHKNGSMVRRVGANKKELHGAVCMEMSPDPKKRQDSNVVVHCQHTGLSQNVAPRNSELF